MLIKTGLDTIMCACHRTLYSDTLPSSLIYFHEIMKLVCIALVVNHKALIQINTSVKFKETKVCKEKLDPCIPMYLRTLFPAPPQLTLGGRNNYNNYNFY